MVDEIRRGLVKSMLALGAAAALPKTAMAAVRPVYVPAEDVRHLRTWMAWPSSRAIWGRQLAGVQKDIASIARTIARFEPVVMCANRRAANQARRACGSGVEVINHIPVDDCWMRDSGPVFRFGPQGSRDAIGLNFNAWGRKQPHRRDQWVAAEVAYDAQLPFSRAGFVGEGGGIESDGDGTLMATESSLLNNNRNPGMTRAALERAILKAYGASKMIWVPGIKGQDITDDHIDATSRFIRPGVVAVQVPQAHRRDVFAKGARQQLAILRKATDARGRRLKVIEIDAPDRLRVRSDDFLDSYVNFALVNGGVITAQFGDRQKDNACRRALAKAFPGRQIVQLNVDRLHAGGGGIHCVTMQQPL